MSKYLVQENISGKYLIEFLFSLALFLARMGEGGGRQAHIKRASGN